jgi:4-hydroxy-2-oxoheptanedioate aldolase
MQPNPFRESFSSGALALGGWLSIPSSVSAEAMAGLDLDYVCIDTQHGLMSYDAALPMLQALTRGRATPLVRVPWKGSEQIGKALDAGAMGVIVPMINTRAEAEEAVAATRYPPAGARSFGPGRAMAIEGADYFEWANDQITCVAMVETVEAVANLDEILSVAGIDSIYVGPSDLAISLGERPATNGPLLNEALATIVAACNKHGVVPGIHASAGLLPQRRQQGFRMVTVVADLVSLRTKLREDMAIVRSETAGPSDSIY